MSRGKYPDRDPQMFYELARDRLANQLATIDALDSKIGLLFTLGSGLLGILAAVFALRASTSDETIGTSAVLVVVAAACAYVVVSFFGVKAYLARSWRVGPDLSQVWADQWTSEDDAVLRWEVANAIWSDYEANRDDVTTKTKALLWIFAGVIVESLLLALALALVAGAA